MSISLLNNNDSGSIARAKINESIAVANTISGSTNAITPGQSGFTGSFLGTASWASNNIYSASIPASSNVITFFTPLSSFSLTVDTGSGGGPGTPGGTDTQIQFNSGSKFSGSGKFTYDYTAEKLTFSGSIYTSGSTIGGGSGHVLTYNTSSGQVFFTASSAIGGGSGTPGGADQEIQFNKSNTSFSGSSNLKYNYTSQTLAFSGSEFSASGSIKFPSLGASSLSYTQIVTLNTSSGQLYYTSSDAVTSPQLKSGSFGVTIDGNGASLTPGEKGYLAMPCSGTLTNWTIATDVAGTLNISLYTSSFTQFQAGNSGSLTSLSLGASTRIASGSLNIPFTDKSIITFRVNTGVVTVTRATVTINYLKS
jgi:hypothetical protein